MKHIHFTITILLAVALLFLHYPLSAEVFSDDEEENIDITVDPTGTPVTRSLYSPVSAMFNHTNNLVYITFVNNIGDITINLTHINTCNTITIYADSSMNSCIIPVTDGIGMYCLEFLLSDGSRYYGFFQV